jgi:hypothetical protein
LLRRSYLYRKVPLLWKRRGEGDERKEKGSLPMAIGGQEEGKVLTSMLCRVYQAEMTSGGALKT